VENRPRGKMAVYIANKMTQRLKQGLTLRKVDVESWLVERRRGACVCLSVRLYVLCLSTPSQRAQRSAPLKHQLHLNNI
jgi:hypothetical protein